MTKGDAKKTLNDGDIATYRRRPAHVNGQGTDVDSDAHAATDHDTHAHTDHDTGAASPAPANSDSDARTDSDRGGH